MQNKIESKILYFEKSTFEIDLMETSKGNKFISIVQINNIIGTSQVLNLNPNNISEIIEILQQYEKQIVIDKEEKRVNSIEAKIYNEYLNKGLNINQLSKLHNISERKVKEIIEKNNLPIVENDIKKHKFGYKFWHKKK